MTFQASWHEIEIDNLKVLLAQGKSGRQIGIELDRSRNSVIGKIHRLGLECHRPPRPPRKPRRKRGEINHTQDRLARRDYQRRALAICEPIPDVQPATAIPFAALGPDHCRYPYGHVPEMMFCGATLYMAGMPYCGKHCAIAYRPDRR